MSTTIAIAGIGEMGVTLARRMIAKGHRVVTLPPRSEASVQRAMEAGIEVIQEEEICKADFFFSVVPSEAALPLAERVALICRGQSCKPVYCDWNAISPALMHRIATHLSEAGIKIVDGGIIGLADWSLASPGPTLYASGADAKLLKENRDLGLQISIMDADLGAASALKLSYAAITKGLIAIASMSALVAEQSGCGAALVDELSRSQPILLRSFSKSVPNMLPKAQRWVSEMQQISEHLDSTSPQGAAYLAFAQVFAFIAADTEAGNMLAHFYDRAPGMPS
ncbi:NAD(P)-dependent oxidoreductase [Mesorhizobium sp.]|uniref:NAD(P)-dependent oxidoreductase n=1 Tax=Mesorhizobium sp. TaxID=1871066 RepID=UPI00121D1C74|nr:NAD(P)-dependent oxidoreductase [Mesorhizobium sp.]TIV62134.1 MAG: NAD(P)-dependent oxidoreductase [Mesorhizobium sp.]